MKEAFLIYNNVHKIIICLNCKAVLNPATAVQHMKKVHDYTPRCKVQEHLDNLFPDAVHHPTLPTKPIKPIFGLCNPIPDYLITECCHRGYRKMDSAVRHKCAGGRAYWPEVKVRKLYVQSFSQGSTFFAVDYSPEAQPEQPSVLSLLKASLSNLDIYTDKIVMPSNARELSVFLEKEGWIEHVKELDVNELIALAGPVEDKNNLPGLQDAVFQYAKRVQSLMQAQPFQLREAIAVRPGTNSKLFYHRIVSTDALKRYACHLTRLLKIVLMSVEGKTGSYAVPLNQDQRQASLGLLELLRLPGVAGQTDGFHSERNFDDEDDLDDDAPLAECVDLEAPEVLCEVPVEHERIQGLLFSLYSQIAGPDEDKFCSPVVRYAVISSIRFGGRWIKGSLITQTNSALLFMGRLAMFQLMHTRAQNERASIMSYVTLCYCQDDY
jgi:hypothetical protein